MGKLILSLDGLVLKEIPLTRERLRIGRKEHNDIQIDNLAISGNHALIVCQPDGVFLEDLDSTNGTRVNGRPIKRHVLSNNDLIELGKYRLKYIAEGPWVAPASVTPVLAASLCILEGGNAGKELQLLKAVTKIGKPGIQIAAITRGTAGFTLTHEEGASLPLLNAQPLEAAGRLLHDQDVIEIAGVKMRFTLLGAPGK